MEWVDHGWIMYLYLPMHCTEFTKYILMCDGANLSNHHPLCAELHWASSPSLVSSHCSRLSHNHLAWYKTTDEQIHAYKSLVMEPCCTIEIPNGVLNCLTAQYITQFLSNYVHNWSIA